MRIESERVKRDITRNWKKTERGNCERQNEDAIKCRISPIQRPMKNFLFHYKVVSSFTWKCSLKFDRLSQKKYQYILLEVINEKALWLDRKYVKNTLIKIILRINLFYGFAVCSTRILCIYPGTVFLKYINGTYWFLIRVLINVKFIWG